MKIFRQLERKQTPFIHQRLFEFYVPPKILKQSCNSFETLNSPSTTRSDHLKKQSSSFTVLVPLIFPPKFDVLLFFDFSSA